MIWTLLLLALQKYAETLSGRDRTRLLDRLDGDLEIARGCTEAKRQVQRMSR